ncbi:PREDICTED: RING finger protein 121-like [Amphimedon queenslandica]|uniref:RING-type domain-containing protein n=2 Tax=Amphimedon queenslandica TaxID=400682 RepID=A0AAN0INF2_AMPQE|nr:PREDICTED: RING finger protein 121-like [Amphimedon queenslandica]|eukprot:XP_011405198.2 PREDICTED: RING finger protein 121-like [Amphimedon queenslandica]
MIEEKHRGHDLMHAEMILILFASIGVAQVLLFLWRIKHRKSYQAITLLGMWIIPFYLCVRLSFWRMIIVWSIFSVITLFVMFKATRKKLHVNTPRIVYRWFLWIYQASYALGIIGYLVLLLVFTGLGLLLPVNPDIILETGVTLVFYGVYYGVMGRDCAEVCLDYMSAAMTYTTGGQSLPKIELASNMCAVCGQRIVLPTEDESNSGKIERTYRLGCGHLFHEFCIRGWCIIGKKQTCPYCQEKVDLKKIFKNPWEKPHILFGQMLDFLRYCVVWLPVILALVQFIYYVFHLE